MMVVSGAILAVLPAVWALPLLQEEPASKTERFKVDPVHTCVWFKINHLGIANFYGRFNEIAGRFVLDAGDAENCEIEVTVPTASVDTNNAERDKHLRAPDYFDADKYPQITFESRKFTKVSDDTYLVVGDLTLHGVTKTITIKLTKTGAGKDPWGNHRVGLETTFTIKRSEYGMTVVPGMLGDEVALTISIEGIRR